MSVATAQQGSDYRQKRRRHTRRATVAACVVASVAVPLHLFIDYHMYPHCFWLLLTARGLSVVLMAGVLLALWGRHGVRLSDGLAVALCAGLALLNAALPVYVLGDDAPYYVTFVLLIFAGVLLLSWGPRATPAFAFGMLALYALAAVGHGVDDGWAFACRLSFVALAVGTALASARASESLQDRQFCTRASLQAALETNTQLAAALTEKTVKIEALNREMEDLLYVASHDLRAPLITVQGFSRELQLGLDRLRSSKAKSPETVAVLSELDESLRFIMSGVSRMESLMGSFLNVSRIATRTYPTEEVDLGRLLEKLAPSFRYQLSEKGIALEVEPLPPVIGDIIRLGQLYSNLIDNAIKYMGDSPERRIHIGVRRTSGQQHFFVQDTGPGIAKEYQEQVFRPFRRLANGDGRGAGIGLTMANKIVEKHGGRIWVDSEPGAGSTFWFTLRPPAVVAGGPQ